MKEGEEKLSARDTIRERRQAQLSHALTCGLKRFFDKKKKVIYIPLQLLQG